MTKKDYIALSKERLAELIIQKDEELSNLRNLLLSSTTPTFSIPQQKPLCYEENGICNNPHMDCINCPKLWRR